MYRTSLSVMFQPVMMDVMSVSITVQNSTNTSEPSRSAVGKGGLQLRLGLIDFGGPVLEPVKEDTILDRNPAVVAVLLDEGETASMVLE